MFNPLAKPLDASKRPRSPLKIQLARSEDDLHQAFELTYRSYFRSGLVVNNPSGLRFTPYHLLPESEVIIGKLRQTVVSTISFFGDGNLGLPMQSMYAREIDNLRNQGLRLGEVGGLADRRVSPRRFISTFAGMARLMVQVAASKNIDTLVAAVHPKHANLYKRVFGFKQVGDHTNCPYANGNPAEALYLRFDQLSTKIRDRFFGDSVSPEQLIPYDWKVETRDHFLRILECDGKIANTVGIKGFFDWGINTEQDAN